MASSKSSKSSKTNRVGYEETSDETPLSNPGSLSSTISPPTKESESHGRTTRTASYDDFEKSCHLISCEESYHLGNPLPLSMFSSKRINTDDPAIKKLPHRVRSFYTRQNEMIECYETLQKNFGSEEEYEIDQELERRAKKGRSNALCLTKLSFGANLVLFAAKLTASILSGSLSVITSVMDSFVDLLSIAVMWCSNRAIKVRDPRRYPQGRTKLEPITIIVLSVIMAVASVVMIGQSGERIYDFIKYDIRPEEDKNETAIRCLKITEMEKYVVFDSQKGPDFGIESLVICASTVVIKLILYLICRKSQSSSVQALAQDHRNDVISNTAAIVFGYTGDQLWKYSDPIGAILISIYIVTSWIKTGLEQTRLLTGLAADPDLVKRFLWVCLHHDPHILSIDAIRAYHFGNNFLVEVDVVLPAEMNVREAHNIGESLQCRLEKLEEVERAFVHVDYTMHAYRSASMPYCEHKVV